ncbi:MAG: class I tRNA ligase family protein, partial [Candidatus Zixiibacteriota bacterium]
PMVGRYRGTNPDLKYCFKPEDLAGAEKALYIKLNQTVKKVTESTEKLQFNTAIAALMELVRDYDPEKISNDQLNDTVILKTILLVAPMAPHMAEEMWAQTGFEGSVFKASWPEFDPDAVVGDSIEIAVQINGKLRDSVLVSVEASQDEVEQAAFASQKVASYTDGKEIARKIYVPGRLLNIVVKG